jgi:hypothetical protein
MEQAIKRINDHIEMLYIQALSSIGTQDTDKSINNDALEAYLKSRGYTHNTIKKRQVMAKDFTCVVIHDDKVEVWHDVNNSKSAFIHGSLLTGLPITLDYYERL